jgi:hypothetical protein
MLGCGGGIAALANGGARPCLLVIVFVGRCSDYRDLGPLDRYEAAMLDDREYGAVDTEARLRAEATMQERDRREGRVRGSRLGAALADDDGAGGECFWQS